MDPDQLALEKPVTVFKAECKYCGSVGQRLVNSDMLCLFVCFFLLLYVPCQQLWSLWDGQFT